MSEVRLAKPADWPAIVAAHREQNERDSTNYPLPPLFAREGGFSPAIALALVVESEGKVTQCVWFEQTTVETMVAGRDPENAIGRDVDAIAYMLRQQGVTGIDCKVPVQVARPIGRRLKRSGFHSEDERFAHFFMDLTETYQ